MIATGRFCCPCWPVLGFTVSKTGVAAFTVKPWANVTTSAPVVSVTSRAPVAAAESMFSTAMALVGELTVKDATVIPVPRLAVVVPCTKCVNCPVIATERFCWPCLPVLGFNVIKTGVPAVTVKLLFSVAVSVPVVSVTFRVPVAAAGSMFSAAVALFGELTVSEATVMPTPNAAVVVPCTKWLNCPVIATERSCCPCWPVFGFTCVNTGVPAVTAKALFKVSISEPVVRVTLRAPVAAAGSIFSKAVALVGEPTVKEVTVIPAPKPAVVVP